MKRLIFLSILIQFFISCKNDINPNILIILTDDQGWGDLSINGNTNLKTPNIDNIALNGASFERFYVSPVCSPTRAELLSGKFFVRSGVNGVTRGYERMNTDVKLISDFFKGKNIKQVLLENGTMAHSLLIIQIIGDLMNFMALHLDIGVIILTQYLKKMEKLLKLKAISMML